MLRVGREVFGADKVSSGNLPLLSSEDYAYFTQNRPGAYFFFLTAEEGYEAMLHNCNFNFNDKLINKAATFWYHLARDRLLLK